MVAESEGTENLSIARLGPKEGFGEMALLTDQPRFASVLAATDVEVWPVPKAAFEELVSGNFTLSLYFNDILSQRLRELEERVYPSA